MTKAPYEIMQNFNAVLQDYNDYRFAVWKRKHGLAAHYAYEVGKDVYPKKEEVKQHISGEYGDDYFELTDGTCLWIAQFEYSWNRDVLNNLKDRNKIGFQKAKTMDVDAITDFALTGKLPE